MIPENCDSWICFDILRKEYVVLVNNLQKHFNKLSVKTVFSEINITFS